MTRGLLYENLSLTFGPVDLCEADGLYKLSVVGKWPRKEGCEVNMQIMVLNYGTCSFVHEGVFCCSYWFKFLKVQCRCSVQSKDTRG